MDSRSWLWVALVAFLVFCFLPMLFMGRRRKDRKRRDQAGKVQDRDDSSK